MELINETFKDRILDLSFSGIYVYDLQSGLNLYINQQYTNLTGYNIEDINEMSQEEFFELFHPDDQALVGRHMKEVIDSKMGHIVAIEYRFKKADGSWMWCCSKDAVFEINDKKQPTQFIGSFTDITKEKLNEEKIKLTNRRLTLAIETKSLVIWETDNVTGDIYWDGKVSEIYGCSSEKISTFDRWSQRVHPDDLIVIQSKLQKAESNKKVGTVEFRIFWDDGTVRNIVSSILAVYDKNGKPTGFVGVNKDITLEKQNKENLLRTRVKLEEVNKLIYQDREKLQYYFDTMPSIILLLDKEGKVEMVNSSGCKLYGYTREEMIGKNFLLNFIPPRLIEKNNSHISKNN